MKERFVTKDTVEQFFVEISAVDRIFKSDRDLNLFLWRAHRADEVAENPLYPDFTPKEIRQGKFRPADVTVKDMNGESYIIPKVYQKRPEDLWKAQGTSLFDKPNTFNGKNWRYLSIPKGTSIPQGLLIIKDDYNDRFDAVHYSIVPNQPMPIRTFKDLLNQLLRNIQTQNGKLQHG